LADDLAYGSGRLSPTLAAAFLGCNASAAWTLEVRRGLREAADPSDDPQAELVVTKGHEHEAECLATLKEQCRDFVEIVNRSWIGTPIGVQKGPVASENYIRAYRWCRPPRIG
jgi:hypothetical protein